MESYDVWGSLWNFETPTNVDVLKVKDYEIVRVKKHYFSDNFWQVVVDPNLPITKQDTKLLLMLCHLYATQQNRDFPPFLIKTKIKSKEDEVFASADKKIKILLNAFRLYDQGDIRGRYLAATPIESKYPMDMFFDLDNIPTTKNVYQFSSPQKLETFMDNLSDIKDLIDTITIDRFNISYTHYNSPIEQLIDLIISLEGLFNKTAFDIKFKVALRTAHLIYSERSPKTQKTYELIKKAYNVRNDVVHGKKLEDKEIEAVISLNIELNKIVRETILKAVELRRDKVLDLFQDTDENKIDEVILNN